MDFSYSYKWLFVLMLFAFNGKAQKNNGTNQRLAMEYYGQNEFEKANLYFDLVYDGNEDAFYPYYFKSLMSVKEYDKAEKITRKYLKRHKDFAHLYVYLARIAKAQNDEKKEKEFHQKALKELEPVQQYVMALATAFTEDGLYDLAIETYNKGKTKDYPFFYEKAEVYKQKGDLRAMINEYLNALEFRETEIGMVQANLQNNLGYDDEEGGIKNPILKQELQKRIQKNPDKVILSEFLVFILKQQKDFDGAFVQAKSLDKRLKEEGSRIYDLARICVSNQKWETARRCYDYLLEKGPDNLYYDMAQVELLNVDYLSVTSTAEPKPEDLISLESRLVKAKEKYQGTNLSHQIIKQLASLRAYYLNKTGEAIELLTELIEQGGLENALKAEYKIMLGDIYLIRGDIWDASLLYSQVEKDFKYEVIGQEAKFRNAKLSFYAGDFQWAKAQADILKGATTKLIANDALDLSLIITDAIGVDTNEVPLRMFAAADLMITQHKYKEAVLKLDSINSLFSSHTLGDDICFKKADIFIKQGKYAEAELMYRNILEFYKEDLYGDDAQFRLAELFEFRMKDNEKARQAYQDVMTAYPGSIFVVEARKRYRELRGDQLKN